MKLMLRPEWRIWPLSSFLGFVDLKTGVIVALIFALLNKVAGVYGLIAVLTGAGGSFAQVSLYIYSVLALAALAWGLHSVQQEDPKHTFYFAHFFAADHVFSTSWTVFFAVAWWLWTPHNGDRQANSAAQQAMVELANVTTHLSTAEREQAALSIWNHEKGKAAAIIVLSWLSKIYFILLLYSYGSHLRKGSYRSLPLTRSAYAPQGSMYPANNAYEALAAHDDDPEDFYRVPLQTPPVSGHRRGGSHHSVPNISADFVSAPGRQSRKKGFGSMSLSSNGGKRDTRIEEEDVLFDEDEMTYTTSNSSRGRIDSSTLAGSGSEEDQGKGKGGVRSIR
ncbi:DUF1753-domain-containing protein [Coprinopsis marcescibilis]|uniref:DUF1753-domain-containing protein n=1 Tax=Coprinopsis marcescibilis TaxID=230819 RepID=A0A5C3LCX1_COPMA|nr:DUF1753-domain-containing protein [Coprinopsis marcescibilis]